MKMAEFTRRVAEDNDWSYSLAKKVTPCFWRTLRNVIAEGNNLIVPDFGTFKVEAKKPRVVSLNGNKISVPETCYPRWTPSYRFREKVKQLDPAEHRPTKGSEESEEE